MIARIPSSAPPNCVARPLLTVRPHHPRAGAISRDDSRITLCACPVARTAGRRSSSMEPAAEGARTPACDSPTSGNLVVLRAAPLGAAHSAPYSERHRSPTVVVVSERSATSVVPPPGPRRCAAVSPCAGPSRLKSFEPWLVKSLPVLPTAVRGTTGPLSDSPAPRRRPIRHAAPKSLPPVTQLPGPVIAKAVTVANAVTDGRPTGGPAAARECLTASASSTGPTAPTVRRTLTAPAARVGRLRSGERACSDAPPAGAVRTGRCPALHPTPPLPLPARRRTLPPPHDPALRRTR